MALSALKSSIANGVKLHIHKILFTRSCSTMAEKYETLDVSVPKESVYLVQLNRPKKLNALDPTMWREFKECFNKLAVQPDCRAIVLAAAGRVFTAGIDLMGMISIGQELAQHDDIARKCKVMKTNIKNYQETFTAIERCPKPVIAAVHGACIGAGVDMVSAADVRYCTADAWFQIKEVDIGMAADVGTLQRLPKVVGSDSLARELVYTGRKFLAAEALQCGFVSSVLEDQEKLYEKAISVASLIASKSPVAVQTSKLSLIYSRDHSVQESLNHIADINQAMLQSEDFVNAVGAQAAKGDPPLFAKL